MKSSLVKLFIVATLVATTGCAAMFNGSSQQISIRSNLDDAKIYVNEAYIGKGNGVTTFKKKEDYFISVRKDGCEPRNVPATKSFDATTLLGVLLDWGIISVLVVDGLATGAWQEFDQTNYVLDPECTA